VPAASCLVSAVPFLFYRLGGGGEASAPA
jgi:hypothetical protein